LGGRQALIDWAKQAATNAGVNLADYFGVVVCMNVPTDLFGGGGRQAVCDNNSMQPSLLGQEMGHGYGLDHARANGSEDDYQDPYDIMSTANAYETPDVTYTDIGPGLNAATMSSQSWLDNARVWKTSGDFDTTVPLRPLHRHRLPGYLAARVGAFLAEYRAREFWDNNAQFPVVLVHRFQNNHSYIMPATDGRKGLYAGSVFQLNTAYFRHRVEVLQIDDQSETAYVRLQFTSLIRPHLEIGARQLVADTASDGSGGYVLIGNNIVPIPSRSSAMTLLEQAAALHAPEALENQVISERVHELVQTGYLRVKGANRGPFRQPAGKGG
jgi:hypothetical protein